MLKLTKKTKKDLNWKKLYLNCRITLCVVALLFALSIMIKNLLTIKPREQVLPTAQQTEQLKSAPKEKQTVTDMQSLIDRELSLMESLQEDEELIEMIADADYDMYEEELPKDVVENHEIDDHKAPEKIIQKEEKTKKIQIASTDEKKTDNTNWPMIAIVVDDMGISAERTKDIISIKAPLTSSFLTYSQNLKKQMKAAQQSGHEVMAHIPMEAKANIDEGPDVLTNDMSKKQIKKTFSEMIDKFPQIYGVNNHMGSKFTENEKKLEEVLKILKEKNMFFLDSKTSPKSAADNVAKKLNLKYVSRNVFLDNENNLDYINKQLKTTEKLAYKNGVAIAICHPKSQTYIALKDWVKTLDEKHLRLVKLSQIVDKLNGGK